MQDRAILNGVCPPSASRIHRNEDAEVVRCASYGYSFLLIVLSGCSYGVFSKNFQHLFQGYPEGLQ